MKKRQETALDFIIDKLTNYIENVQSGGSFPTDISLLTASELIQTQSNRKTLSGRLGHIESLCSNFQ